LPEIQGFAADKSQEYSSGWEKDMATLAITGTNRSFMDSKVSFGAIKAKLSLTNNKCVAEDG
jgi:hypothetical protein